MLLRIFLILSILAGIGIIAISHFKVRPHVESIIDERNKQTTRANGLERDLNKTKGELASTQKTLQRTQDDLSRTQTQLTAATKRANDFEARSNDLKTKLDKTTDELTTARQNLEAWRLVDKTPAEVLAIIDDNKKLKLTLDIAYEEYTIQSNAYFKLSMLYSNLVGTGEIEVPMRDGLKGKVLVVDPKWNFVVLDVGEKEGALPNGVMMVSRNSKLVAKVKLVSVQPDRSIANILPGWKLDEVMEGDDVIY